jgi:hypothetical protein
MPLGVPDVFITPFQDKDYFDSNTGICAIPEGTFIESSQIAYFNAIDDPGNFTLNATDMTFNCNLLTDPKFSNFRDPNAPLQITVQANVLSTTDEIAFEVYQIIGSNVIVNNAFTQTQQSVADTYELPTNNYALAKVFSFLPLASVTSYQLRIHNVSANAFVVSDAVNYSV